MGHERQANSGSDAPGAPQEADPFEAMMRRRSADLLCLWHLCDRAACRRGRRCRDPEAGCIDRHSNLVPLKARLYLAGHLYAIGARVPQEEIEAKLRKLEAVFTAWRVACGAGDGVVQF